MRIESFTSLLEKHRRIASLICCPRCHGALEHNNASTLGGVPIFSELECAHCGEVGYVANGKYIFNGPKPKIEFKARQLNGTLSINNKELDEKYFFPKAAWNRITEKKIWSEEVGAKFAFISNDMFLSLIFLKHAWSGIVDIIVDGKKIDRLDLYTESGLMPFCHLIYLGEGEHVVEAVVTGEKNPASQAAQVFILSAQTLAYIPSTIDELYYEAKNNGNLYPYRFDELVAKLPQDGMILDCGCGDRSYPDARVVNFEYLHYNTPDVFGDNNTLPFKENSFDLILSQAVIEHLYDPFGAMKELKRVLKPGGKIYAESAFTQPLHSAPYHFFNTTGFGMKNLFKEFTVLDIGYEGKLAQTLEWIYSLTALRQKGFGNKISKVLALIEEMDAHITTDELMHFASYVRLLAEKPLA